MRPGRLAARRAWVRVHRWAGLTLAAFLVVVGLTGSLLAFDHELERWLAPRLFATPRTDVAPLSLGELAARAERLVPQGRLAAVLRVQPDQVLVTYLPRPDARTGQRPALGFTELYLDPWTGTELGRRDRHDLHDPAANLMPWIYELHWRLLAGRPGQLLLGGVALLWTLDCIVGAALTLPRSRRRFWPRWRLAWQVRHRAPRRRVLFDLHRATGLWLWPCLGVFAWSGVMLNLRPVYEAVTATLFDYQPTSARYFIDAHAIETPRLGWAAAAARGAELVAEQGRAHGFRGGEPLGLMYDAGTGGYWYEVRGSRDVFERAPQGGSTSVIFDGDSGRLRSLSVPTGEHAGNTVESWLYALHMARVFGRPYQVLVAATGAATALLSVTGVYLWWRRRRPRAGRVAAGPGEGGGR